MIERKIENFEDYENALKIAHDSSEPVRISGSSGEFFLMSNEARAHERWVAGIEAALDRSERQFAEDNYYDWEDVKREISETYFHGNL